MMSRRTSRTGGDYVWMSRSLGGSRGAHHLHGHHHGDDAIPALIALSAVFAIGSVGCHSGNSGFQQARCAGSDPNHPVPGRRRSFAALIALNILRPRLGFKLISVLMVVGLFALALLSSGRFWPPAGGSRRTTSTLSGMTDSNSTPITYLSLANSYTGAGFDLGATISILPSSPSSSIRGSTPPRPSDRSSRGRRATWNAPISGGPAFLMVTVPLAVMYYVGVSASRTPPSRTPTLVYDVSFNFWTLPWVSRTLWRSS